MVYRLVLHITDFDVHVELICDLRKKKNQARNYKHVQKFKATAKMRTNWDNYNRYFVCMDNDTRKRKTHQKWKSVHKRTHSKS